MKIKIPKIVVPVDFGAYAPELAGNQLQVWVNPPMQFLQEYNDLVAELQMQELESARQMFEAPKADEKPTTLEKTFDQAENWLKLKQTAKPKGLDPRFFDWYAKLWSQSAHADDHWTAEELRTLEENDPTLLSWMITQTWTARAVHAELKKKG